MRRVVVFASRVLAAFLAGTSALTVADDGAPREPRFTMLHGEAEERARQQLGDSLDARRGGGAAVSGLLVVQIGYFQQDSQLIVWLKWSVNGPNPDGITVSVDGVPQVTLPGDQTDVVLYTLAESELGEHLWEVQGGGTVANDYIFLVAAQPFDDPSALSCREGARDDPVRGTCRLGVEIANANPPGFYLAWLDDVPVNNIPGNSRLWEIPGVAAGHHCVRVMGYLESGGSDYLGGGGTRNPPTSCCDILCKDEPCDAPFQLSTCQHAFGLGAGDNKVTLRWMNSEQYDAINVTLDGQPYATVPGNLTETALEGLAPGEHVAALEGDCGAEGKSRQEPLSFSVIASSPQGNPMSDLNCSFPTPSGARIVATWRNLAQASAIEVYLIDPQDQRRLARTLPGEATLVSVEGTVRTDRLGLRFLFDDRGLCYASRLFVCTPPPPPGFKYLTGDCDANANIDITDAIFALDLLFKGGRPSPCEVGCDANVDDKFNLADAMYLVLHLFQAGPPPAGAYPKCDETKPDDVCRGTTCAR